MKSRLLATALLLALVGLMGGITQSAYGRPLFHVVSLGISKHPQERTANE
jgi:hypothetical protein